MGADKSREYYFHRWKNWGLPGIAAGRIVDATRVVLHDIGSHRVEQETNEQMKQESLRADIGDVALVGATQE